MQGCSFSKRYAEMEVALRVMGSTRNGCRFYLNKGYDCSGNKSIMSAWFLQTRTVARCFFLLLLGFFFSFLKCTHSFSIVSRSPTNRFVCPRRLHVASLPSRPGTGRILQLELPLLWRAQLKGCALPSDLPCMCVVSWRSGFPGSPIHACPSSC